MLGTWAWKAGGSKATWLPGCGWCLEASILNAVACSFTTLCCSLLHAIKKKVEKHDSYRFSGKAHINRVQAALFLWKAPEHYIASALTIVTCSPSNPKEHSCTRIHAVALFTLWEKWVYFSYSLFISYFYIKFHK